MAQQRLGIIMNGVTGRMGMNQHLIRSINAIRAQGGVTLRNGDTVVPDPILVGRNERKLAQLAKENGVARWTTDLEGALKNAEDTLFFDAATTKLRASLLHKAIAAGKNIYCEKPIAETLEDALDVARAARKAGIKHGVVQDKLFLPGLLKLRTLVDAGFFGRLAAGPAAVLELSQEGRRRHYSRHAVPLALRAGQSVWRRGERLLSGRNSHPKTLGRGRQAL
jgi:predicted dehydrogenase